VSDPRRNLPAVDALLAEPDLVGLLATHPRALVVRAVRETIDLARANGGAPPHEGWSEAARARVAQLSAPSLGRVINATGVVLHTNLGRAVLADAATEALTRVARGYSALEYDVARGTRGSRHTHCRDLLMELTAAEDALVVNNAAAALLLVLSATARDGEAIVSRGELIEIGGQFRIPDILARSGARLVEVGTTNRTHPDDYARAIGPATRVLLKVHPSNFRVMGFTSDVPPNDVAALATARGVTSVYDLGSGLLLDLSRWGLSGEPTIKDALASGVDAVVFSGDKLLGGPQAGIVVGKSAVITACRSDPIARAVRADKFTLAALEATLALYRDPEHARQEIPVLRMLTTTPGELRRRADELARALPAPAQARSEPGFSEVGGGSFPGAELPTTLVRLHADRPAAETLAAALRRSNPPVIARIDADRVVLDPRTILPGEEQQVANAVRAACDG